MRKLSRRISIGRILIMLAVPAFVAGICAIDAFYIEPYYPRVIRQEIFIKDLPKQLEGLKIVHLSDLHIVKLGKREDRALAKIARIEPDLVCMTGDYIMDDGITPGDPREEQCVREVKHFCYRLKAKHGIYAVLGNWDPPHSLPAAVADAGVKMLDDTWTTVKIRGASLTLSGSKAVQHGWVRRRPLIMMDHFPEAAGNLARTGRHADLVLAGHWHGGQVNLPGQTPKVEYLAGHYTIGDVQLYVSRGLGMHTHAVRFRCPAEITLIVLRRG